MSTLGGVAQIWSLTVVTMERAWVVTCITTDRVHKVAHAQSAPELECQHVTAGVQVHDQAGGDVHLARLHAGQRPAAPGHEQIRVRGTYTVKYLHIYNLHIYHAQGYLYSSSIDYLTRDDAASTAYCWLLLLLAWGLPNILILASHIIIVTIYRSEETSAAN